MDILKRLPILFPVVCLWVFGIGHQVNAQTMYEAQLSGSNAVPAITSPASGTITATLNGNVLVVEGSFEGLTGDYSASHIHIGMAGEAGGVMIPLTASVNEDNRSGAYTEADNTFELSSGQIDTLDTRLLYINIHSSNYPGGEIRGQLVPQADAYFRTNLSGAFSMSAVKTRGSGSAILELRDDSLFISGAFSGLSEAYTASHIHAGLTGVNGGVEFGLTPSLNEDETSGVWLASDNKFELTAGQKEALMNREYYINVHTTANPGGEIRGQITPPVTAFFYASLSGSATNPSLNVDGSGAYTIELAGDLLHVSGSFSGLQSGYTASHIHSGYSHQNGGVLFGLSAETEDDMAGTYGYSENTFGVSAEQINTLFNRGLYINVHSSDNSGGELRGQILGEAQAYFRTKLNGLHENDDPNFDTEGSGAVDIEVSGTRAIVSGGFDQLSAAYSSSHVHAGPVSENGGVEIVLNPIISEETMGVFMWFENFFSLSNEQLDALYNEGTYVNVHTSANPGGEIRGQLLFGENAFPTAVDFVSPEDGAEFTVSGDPLATLTVEWSAPTDANDHELRNTWALATDDMFDDIVLMVNAGSETSAEVTFAELDSLLAELEVDIDASTTLYHSVVTTDGSLESFSENRTITLTKGTITSNEEEPSEKPFKFGVEQNYPNPFNPVTNISFTLNKTSQASITVYNMLGQKVKELLNERLTAGEHSVVFDGENVSSGIYFYQLRTGENTVTKQMTLIK